MYQINMLSHYQYGVRHIKWDKWIHSHYWYRSLLNCKNKVLFRIKRGYLILLFVNISITVSSSFTISNHVSCFNAVHFYLFTIIILSNIEFLEWKCNWKFDHKAISYDTAASHTNDIDIRIINQCGLQKLLNSRHKYLLSAVENDIKINKYLFHFNLFQKLCSLIKAS